MGDKGKGMESFSKHWHIVVYMVGLVFIGGMTFADNSDQNRKIVEHEERLNEDDKREIDDAVRFAEIRLNQEMFKEDVEEIKDDVDEIKSDVKEILKALQQK